MKKLIIIFVVIITCIFTLITTRKDLPAGLVSPILSQFQTFKEPSPVPTLKTFKFDESTNLNQELNSINPEVKVEDFVEFTNLVSGI